MEYGLIGSRLGHSYSKIIHQRLCGYDYQLLALPTEAEARRFLEERPFRAVNVTIPYKRLAMDACDQVDPRAAAIGAVNTVVNRDGRLYGYNTDFMGFAHLCRSHGVDFRGRTVLILGTGGTHNTVAAVARDAGAARVLTVSRKPGPGQLSYREAAGAGGQILINTTPAGMYPDVGTCLLDTDALRGMEAVLDVVYNPVRTELLLRAGEAGVPVRACGLEMLVAQAVYAAEYFLDTAFADREETIRRGTADLRRDILNVSLVGMPSSGKTTLGRLLAEKLGRTFVDLDEEIVRAAGRSIPGVPSAGSRTGGPLWQRERPADLLRGRHRQKRRQHPGFAAERGGPVHRPAPGGADGGGRTSSVLQPRGAAADGKRAPALLSGGGGRRHPQRRHGAAGGRPGAGCPGGPVCP